MYFEDIFRAAISLISSTSALDSPSDEILRRSHAWDSFYDEGMSEAIYLRYSPGRRHSPHFLVLLADLES